ncbi:replicative DNA helicase [Fusobacterium massiliense]|uniref:replicative DNA helicase n=1 Tax=Fusobacterium massiliense TaxID=1852365 RepID=UPI0028D735F3|nr:replicative DNA helicase [Fusobacterium massiliense]
MEESILQKIPHSLEAEKALIGGIFYDNEIFDEIQDLVRADDFYNSENSAIFELMNKLHSESRGIDPVLVADEIKRSNFKNKEEIQEVLSEILEDITSSYNLLEYAELIKEKAMLRKLGNIGAKITEIAYREEGTADSIVDKAEEMVLNLSNKILKSEIINIGSLSVDELTRLDEMRKNKDKILGIPTGFVDLDRMTGGLNNSDLIILAARPAMGKTAFALNLALNAANISNKNVLIFSLEMPAQQLYQRLLAMESEIGQGKIKMGNLTEDEWARMAFSMGNLSSKNIFVADLPNTNVLEIRSYARKMKSNDKLDLIVIDYLQLINGTRVSRGEFNRQQEVSDISRALKGLARELNVPIIALSQLSRSVEQRMDKRPMLSDLRESGAIEQDADIVAFLYREDYYIPETENKGISELIIGKHRNGAVGTIKLLFLNEITKFKSYTDKIK